MSNDLISRSALLEAMEEERQYLIARGLRGAEHILVHHCLPLIDNAPTVEVGYLTNCANCERVEKIRAKRPQGRDNFDVGYIQGLEDGRNEARPQGEWIPVSERLPEKGNQSYLVTVDYGEGIICSCQRFFFNDEIGWNDNCVIAWQPLPEPYMKGGAEND